MKNFILVTVLALSFNGCAYKHFADSPEPVAIENLDVDQSIIICEHIMNRVEKKDSTPKAQVLGFWALRAQKISATNAKDIARVYFEHIEDVQNQKEFYLWHYTWAIADMYRLGSSEVQQELQLAYDDAVPRGVAIEKEKFVAGDKLLLGYFHFGGWAAAKNYLVAPGNRRFNQSVEAYFEEEKK